MTLPSIDVVQAFWDNRPCNLRHSPAPIGTKEYFDQVEARKYFVEPHIAAFADFPRWRGRRVLELGCGIGTDAVNFARAGADYTAVDLSLKSLELAKRRFNVFGLQGKFYHGSIEELETVIPVESYDLVYAFGVVHHTPSPRKVVASVKNFMSPSSEFRLMLYAKNSWKNAMISVGLDQPEAQSGCPVAYTYEQREVEELLEGFEVFEYGQDHIFPYVIEKYLRYEYELQPWFRSMPLEMFRALEKAFGWHSLVKARLAR